MIDDAVLLDIPESLPKVTGRHVGNDRAAQDMADILKLLSFLDVRKHLELLPRYVTDDSDRVPSVNLSEGDLKFFFTMLGKTDTKLDTFSGMLSSMAADLNGLKSMYYSLQSMVQQSQANLPGVKNVLSYRATNPARRVEPASSSYRPTTGESIHQGNSNNGNSNTDNTATSNARPEQRQSRESGVRWSSVTSTPTRNRYDELGSASDNDIVPSDNGEDRDPFTVVV